MGAQIIPDITMKQQARAMAIGLLTVLTLGMAAALALVIGAIWALAEILLLALQSIVECTNVIAATYESADPLVKFLLLVGIGYAFYRAARPALRRLNR